KEARYYLHISCATIDLLLNDDFFKNIEVEKFRRIVLCIEDYVPHFDRILARLAVYEFKINLNYHIVDQVNFGILLKYEINGLFINNVIEERNKTLAILSTINYELLTNFNYPDYDNLVIRSEDYLKADNT
ncbi:MAG: hypothetical protein PHX62_08190, partial [Bacilli bacterium]|nr:hypothetical protein [Bacilli bacterium]